MIYAGVVIILIILIACSAFFSASEAALTSLSRLSVRQMIKEKKRNAKKIQKLLANQAQMITTILIGNNLINIFASSLATAFAVTVFGETGVGIAAAMMTILIIIFGEIFPKTTATQRPKETAQWSSPALIVLQKIFFPFVWIFTAITKGITKVMLFFWKAQTPIITEEELKSIIDVGSQEGILQSSEKEMLHRIFEFTDLRVRDIMQRRIAIITISEKARLSEILRTFKDTGFSRLPVCAAASYPDNEHIIGTLHYKDVLFFLSTKTAQDSFVLKNHIRTALFVPEVQDAVSLLQTFRSSSQNLAIAVNEHGSISGLVTMDDILQAVFGSITDEYSNTALPPEERIHIISHTEFRVPGDIDLNEFNHIFSLHLESDFYRTLAGYLLEAFGYLPVAGEIFSTETADFLVEEQHSRCIQSIKVSIKTF